MRDGAQGLERHGLEGLGAVRWNLSAAELVERALAREEGRMAANGAFTVRTGKYTGRSPQDRFIVRDAAAEGEIDWGAVNQPMEPEVFDRLFRKAAAYLQGKEVFVFDGYAGADPAYRLPIRTIQEQAWQNLFVRQLFIRPSHEQLAGHDPEFTLICVPGLKADPERDGTRSECFIAISFERRLVLIGGTAYAGEQKKAIFSVLNFLLPSQGVLPMHCAASVSAGDSDDVALFFGLSGTGKTTLSADPERRLIGDDEHAWSDEGVFNLEGGCYAKCSGLREAKEPQIWEAIRFGAVLENVVLEESTRQPDYDDETYTENTRAAYPLEHIPRALIPGVAGHPRRILFLTADAFGVLPPIARLTPEQAKYHFLSGYTSKLAGTERGVNEPEATFSACFGAPFLPRSPVEYARLFGEKLRRHGSKVYLVNTGWTGGPYGTGRRIDLAHTRALVRAALSGALDDAPCEVDPIFGLQVPLAVPGVPGELLQPRQTWDDPAAYDETARSLAARFARNAERFAQAEADVAGAGPGR